MSTSISTTDRSRAIFISVAILCGIGASPAYAQVADGSRFLGACGAAMKQADGIQISDTELAESIWCIGYVSGFMDSLSISAKVNPGRQPACLPAQGITNDQAIRIFVKYLRENPGQLHESGRMSFMVSLAKVFPCR